jgi:hypothetical protein
VNLKKTFKAARNEKGLHKFYRTDIKFLHLALASTLERSLVPGAHLLLHPGLCAMADNKSYRFLL